SVTSVDDLEDGYQGLPPTDGIRIGLEGGAQVIARPSGTEPKLKCYLEVVVEAGDDVDAARREADERLAAIKADLAALLGL
ncbi:hypothetical protein, partial [Klebsiella pneumoniae]|uniref:hypothetical protein n=1 Tax=Klebsiella pneumoniae TaxID=573 RepID=UPI001E2E99AC